MGFRVSGLNQDATVTERVYGLSEALRPGRLLGLTGEANRMGNRERRRGCSVSAFHASVGGWDMSRVTRMDTMFRSAQDFNADSSRWKTSKGRVGLSMFSDLSAFNVDVSRWVSSAGTRINYEFESANAHQRSIGCPTAGWDEDRRLRFETGCKAL